MDSKKAKGYDNMLQSQRIVLLGTPVLVKRWGFCQPHNIRFIKQKRTLYRRDKTGEVRREFFFGRRKAVRIYVGDQFCFLEYCQIAYDGHRFPKTNELVGKGLDETTIELYSKQLEIIVK